jgi:multiple sugar transport system permease protein
MNIEAKSVSVDGGRGLKPRPGRRKFSRTRLNDLFAGYGFTLPSAFVLFIFTLGPALVAFYLSFFSWSLLNHMHFVGLANFWGILHYSVFWIAVRNSVLFACVVVPVQTVIALALAVLLNQNMPARGFFRLAFYFPSISSSAVITIIFMWMFNQLGLVNSFLSWLGISGPDWLGSPHFALPTIMILNIWTTAGTFMIIFLAGLQAIPVSYIEAAAVDGATGWHTFRRITLPLLRTTLFFIVVMGVIGTLQMFDQSFIMSGGSGGPLHSTTTVVLLIYNFIFAYGNVGYGAAATVLWFIFILGATLATNKWLGQTVDY